MVFELTANFILDLGFREIYWSYGKSRQSRAFVKLVLRKG